MSTMAKTELTPPLGMLLPGFEPADAGNERALQRAHCLIRHS